MTAPSTAERHFHERHVRLDPITKDLGAPPKRYSVMQDGNRRWIVRDHRTQADYDATTWPRAVALAEHLEVRAEQHDLQHLSPSPRGERVEMAADPTCESDG